MSPTAENKLAAFRGSLLLAGIFSVMFAAPALAQTRTPLTGKTLDQQLDSALVANRSRVSLREGLNMLAEHRRIALLLDRRIDGEQLFELAVNASYFDEGIAQLVEPLGAEVRVVGDTVYVGPHESAAKIRTRVELARRQIEAACQGNPNRRLDLKVSAPVSWLDLTTPRGIAQGLAARYKLTIENPEAIPHDLWPAGMIASADAAEALLLILTQFDMGVEWIDAGTIRFVTAVADPVVEVSHRVDRAAQEKLLQTLKAAYPEREFSVRGNNAIVLSALLEEHDEIDLLLGNKPGRKPPVSAKATPLANRRFTLDMPDQPFPRLVALLQQQGLAIEFDADAARKAGVDVDKRLTLNLKEATIQELLDKSAGAIGLAYRLEGEKIIVERKP